MAFVEKLPETKVQLGPAPDSALSVRQIPPPAAATHKRHLLWPQSGEIANAVMRPEVV
jgi:hypothetical protein